MPFSERPLFAIFQKKFDKLVVRNREKHKIIYREDLEIFKKDIQYLQKIISKKRSNRSAFAAIAQLVEHFHGKEGVSGSSPDGGSIIKKSMKQNTVSLELSLKFADFLRDAVADKIKTLIFEKNSLENNFENNEDRIAEISNDLPIFESLYKMITLEIERNKKNHTHI